MIRIYRTPQRSDGEVSIAVSGEILTINGVQHDLSGVHEPVSIESPFIVGAVFRLDGDVHVRVIAPYKAGETPAEHDDMPAAPKQENALLPLTARQLRLGLLSASILPAQVGAAIAAIPDDQQRAAAEIEWEYASQFERDHPLIEQVGTAFGLTPEQIDTMWEEALSL